MKVRRSERAHPPAPARAGAERGFQASAVGAAAVGPGDGAASTDRQGHSFAGLPVVQRSVQDRVGAASSRNGAHQVLQMKNDWYMGGPRYTTKTNPLHAIATAVESDTGISKGTVLKHWKDEENLQIAKTYKKMLAGGTLADYERPDEAAAWLDTPNPNPGKRKDPSWITAVGNLGTVEDQIKGDTPQSYNGGHLIAWEFLNENANVRGNIAPQAMLQNQALFRRIERTLEQAVDGGKQGIEVGVKTPYNGDPYSVTYQDLIDRQVISNPAIQQGLATRDVLGKSITLDQMAPDTYDLYFLTQVSALDIASSDKREGREGITTQVLETYQGSAVNKGLTAKPPPLTILATNYNPETADQEAAAFAHVVFLNYRSNPTAEQEMGSQAEEGAMDVEAKYPPEDVQRATEFINDNLQLAIPILQYLQDELGMVPTKAHLALVYALLSGDQEL